MLEGPCGLGVALLLKPCLLVLPDLTDDLLVEVLHDMEAIIDDVQVRKPLKKGALEVCVHVAGYGLHMGHPLSEHKVAEIKHDLPPLGMDKPQGMPCP